MGERAGEVPVTGKSMRQSFGATRLVAFDVARGKHADSSGLAAFAQGLAILIVLAFALVAAPIGAGIGALAVWLQKRLIERPAPPSP